MADSTTDSPDTLHKPLPSLGLSFPIFTVSNWYLKSGYLSEIYRTYFCTPYLFFPISNPTIWILDDPFL